LKLGFCDRCNSFRPMWRGVLDGVKGDYCHDCRGAFRLKLRIKSARINGQLHNVVDLEATRFVLNVKDCSVGDRKVLVPDAMALCLFEYNFKEFFNNFDEYKHFLDLKHVCLDDKVSIGLLVQEFAPIFPHQVITCKCGEC
jgi:hypothetical protein